MLLLKVHARLLKDKNKFDVMREQYLYHSRYSVADVKYLKDNLAQRDFDEKLPTDLDR